MTFVKENLVKIQNHFDFMMICKIANGQVKQFRDVVFFRNADALDEKGENIKRGDGFDFNGQAAALEWLNEVIGVATCKEEACEMRIGFHRASERLLAYQGKCVGVVDDNPAKTVGFRVGGFAEIIDFVTNCVDTSVFFAAQPENRLNLKGGFVTNELQNFLKKNGFPTAWWTR